MFTSPSTWPHTEGAASCSRSILSNFSTFSVLVLLFSLHFLYYILSDLLISCMHQTFFFFCFHLLHQHFRLLPFLVCFVYYYFLCFVLSFYCSVSLHFYFHPCSHSPCFTCFILFPLSLSLSLTRVIYHYLLLFYISILPILYYTPLYLAPLFHIRSKRHMSISCWLTAFSVAICLHN